MSGSRLVLDTNAVIALQRNDTTIQEIVSKSSELFIPSIVVGELYFGAYKSQKSDENRRRLSVFVAERAVLIPNIKTAETYGLVKYRLRVKGRPIPENDIWIAAITLQYGFTLLTNDAHFDEIEGLKLQGW